jgi:hypothetical protein
VIIGQIDSLPASDRRYPLSTRPSAVRVTPIDVHEAPIPLSVRRTR